MSRVSREKSTHVSISVSKIFYVWYDCGPQTISEPLNSKICLSSGNNLLYSALTNRSTLSRAYKRRHHQTSGKNRPPMPLLADGPVTNRWWLHSWTRELQIVPLDQEVVNI